MPVTANGSKGVTMIPPMPIAAEVMNVLSSASSLGRCLGSGGRFIVSKIEGVIVDSCNA